MASSRKSLTYLVGAGRFELPTPCSRSKCATRLRYAPPDRMKARWGRICQASPPYSGRPAGPQGRTGARFRCSPFTFGSTVSRAKPGHRLPELGGGPYTRLHLDGCTEMLDHANIDPGRFRAQQGVRQARGAQLVWLDAETALGFVDQLEHATTLDVNRRAQSCLTPTVQRRQLFASGEEALINDLEWRVEGAFRLLFCKPPVQCPCPHALSPESAKS